MEPRRWRTHHTSPSSTETLVWWGWCYPFDVVTFSTVQSFSVDGRHCVWSSSLRVPLEESRVVESIVCDHRCNYDFFFREVLTRKVFFFRSRRFHVEGGVKTTGLEHFYTNWPSWIYRKFWNRRSLRPFLLKKNERLKTSTSFKRSSFELTYNSWLGVI